MTLSMSRVVASTSNSGLRAPGAPTSASTAVPPRSGLGAVATGWQPMTMTAANKTAAVRRLREMLSYPYVGHRADQERGHENPGRPVDLPLEAPAGPIPAPQPTITTADRAAQA